MSVKRCIACFTSLRSAWSEGVCRKNLSNSSTYLQQRRAMAPYISKIWAIIGTCSLVIWIWARKRGISRLSPVVGNISAHGPTEPACPVRVSPELRAVYKIYWTINHSRWTYRGQGNRNGWPEWVGNDVKPLTSVFRTFSRLFELLWINMLLSGE